jgi:delta(3,5)-delta(2,4)-dienoyl-CoA isomerase
MLSFALSNPAPWILKIQLERGKVNAMNDNFFLELRIMFDKVRLDGEIRVVILCSGLEKFFSAGLDLKEASLSSLSGKDPARDAIDFLNSPLKNWQDAISAIETCRKPVICCLNGFAIGGYP